MHFHLLVLFLTASANAASRWYSIWPLDGDNGDVNDKIGADLQARIGGDNVHHSHSAALSRDLYWYALLDDADKARYDKFPGVRYVALPESEGVITFSSLLRRKPPPATRDTGLDSQKPAPDHLKIVSQAKGQNFNSLDGYYHLEQAGDGTNIYVIDTGLYNHPAEFTNTKIRWLHAGPFADQTENDADSAKGNGHGTCMASIALGHRDGVAKRANLVVVRADIDNKGPKIPDARAVAPERWIDALGETIDDIVKNNLQGKSVISMSWGADVRRDSTYDSCIKDTFVALLNGITTSPNNVIAVAAAGQNSGFPDPANPEKIITYPAVMGGPKGEVPRLLVVGSVDKKGAWEDGTRHNVNTIAALGDGAECAKSSGGTDKDYHTEHATSPATAAVAGLAAYFISIGNSAQDAHDMVVSKAYPRTKNGKGASVIWNMVDTRS